MNWMKWIDSNSNEHHHEKVTTSHLSVNRINTQKKSFSMSNKIKSERAIRPAEYFWNWKWCFLFTHRNKQQPQPTGWRTRSERNQWKIGKAEKKRKMCWSKRRVKYIRSVGLVEMRLMISFVFPRSLMLMIGGFGQTDIICNCLWIYEEKVVQRWFLLGFVWDNIFFSIKKFGLYFIFK